MEGWRPFGFDMGFLLTGVTDLDVVAVFEIQFSFEDAYCPKFDLYELVELKVDVVWTLLETSFSLMTVEEVEHFSEVLDWGKTKELDVNGICVDAEVMGRVGDMLLVVDELRMLASRLGVVVESTKAVVIVLVMALVTLAVSCRVWVDAG